MPMAFFQKDKSSMLDQHKHDECSQVQCAHPYGAIDMTAIISLCTGIGIYVHFRVVLYKVKA